MNVKPSFIQPPSKREKKVLRLMILIGLLSILFFLYTMLQKRNVSYLPLYILLMITMSYYCFKFLHEWYHYFSISASKKPVANKIYSVDILTTYCAGEPFDMLETTLIAIRNITYPHTAWCCDEADDPNVKKLCARLGVKHVTRVIKKNAKAGNINNALQYATGELCVVLDPDHIPSPQFLDEVVPYFNDQSIGFVQVVQAYYNQNESLVAKGAAQQTYQFYGPMMMAMHTYDTVQAIGANCTFRRSALDSIGGHASGLAEDMHTAMQLHAGGWRSIYVPAILTRGLVPATMSSYYKQQLKWSRGTWELLVSVYPKLFKKFSWRQKIHYLTLPFHYLSGFIFLINFLIPVISLFTGYIPLQMDVVDFLLAAMPLFMMSILIRHYVQKWVAEEKERGFHMVGGILQIGTWWIHSIGFIYTLIRKKVPYIPTPKNDNDPLPFLLSLPNIIVAAISTSAIVYGIWRDYNPYTIFMVMLTSMQIFFMLFILSISGHIRDTAFVNNVAQKVRGKTWLIIKTHGILRSYSLPLSLIVIVTFVFSYNLQQQLPGFLPKPLPGLNVFYYGLQNDEMTGDSQGPQQVLSIAKTRKDIAIISLPVSWSAAWNNRIDTVYLQKIYDLHSIPLLVWKPLQQDSSGAPGKDLQVLHNIIGGRYDKMILSFARQVARLNKPVYLCFNNNDSAQNIYPLLAPVNCNPTDYVAAWQYIHRLFDKVGGSKIIWIWKPWNANSVTGFFPGLDYVDWLGIDNPGFIQDHFNNNAVSFYFRYKPYHLSPVFKSGLPVMITRLNSSQEDQHKWWKATWERIATDFPEIKSVVICEGQNEIPAGNTAPASFTIHSILKEAPHGSVPVSLQPLLWAKAKAAGSGHRLPAGIKSILYNKGFYWFRNRHTLNLNIIESDVTAMKEIGVNTIERTMPGVYDKTLNKILEESNINLIPRFRILANPEVIDNTVEMQKQKETILSVIKDNLDNKHVIAWNIGEDVLYSLENQTYQPDYFYYEQKYLTWLSDVCDRVRALDSTRPIVMDLHWDERGKKRLQYYKNHVPQIDTYMLEADSKYPAGLKEPLTEKMAWGKVGVDMWPLVPAIKYGGIIPSWQDIENTDYINLNGLLDLEGRKKEDYKKVVNTWGNKSAAPSQIPDIKILKPAKVTYEKTSLSYRLLVSNGKGGWKLYNNDLPGIHIEWYLVRVDQYRNTMFIKKKGEGANIVLSIPKDPQFYRLYAEAVMGDETKYTFENLNIPLE